MHFDTKSYLKSTRNHIAKHTLRRTIFPCNTNEWYYADCHAYGWIRMEPVIFSILNY